LIHMFFSVLYRKYCAIIHHRNNSQHKVCVGLRAAVWPAATYEYNVLFIAIADRPLQKCHVQVQRITSGQITATRDIKYPDQ